jgi:alkanesulfonate monooxygenase SsuD/methylene tetrahydromethanopterin reductase-like flavin-dependent oxidoreductase (luciferase family)
MKFGIIAGPVFPPHQEMSTAVAVQVGLQLSIAAQQNGFEGISVPHHYLAGPLAQEVAPLVYAGYLAASCPGMYLATTILQLPLEQPVAIAEQTATVDAMTGGRFIFGVVQGYRQIEFDSMGVLRSEKAPRIVESCRLLRQLWTGKEVEFEGKFFRVPGGTPCVAPTRPGGPPIMVGADALVSIARIPEYADFWVPSARQSRKFIREMLPEYKKSLERIGRTFQGIPMTRDVSVAENRDQAIALAKECYQRQYNIQMRWKQPGENYDVSFEELIEDRLIAGSPEEVTEEILRDHEEFGADFVWFRMYWPGADLQKSLDMIKLMGDKVIPRVQDRVGGKSLFDFVAK